MASGPREGEHPSNGNSWAKGPLEEMSVQGTESRPGQPALAKAQCEGKELEARPVGEVGRARSFLMHSWESCRVGL